MNNTTNEIKTVSAGLHRDIRVVACNGALGRPSGEFLVTLVSGSRSDLIASAKAVRERIVSALGLDACKPIRFMDTRRGTSGERFVRFSVRAGVSQ